MNMPNRPATEKDIPAITHTYVQAWQSTYRGLLPQPTRGQYDYRFSSIPTISGPGKASYRASYCVILCP